ncbi:hypothetical protein [Amycolatopsis thermophila]|uniref:Uncharacterized protein n=1 Tax=Amycolatopsis thermophila TaxID=206084 RepID=A0ABU0ETB8_9PSEU|nr:hypothetical protein [Amycolatopsis thermophila]MDQ0378551.1 hypothetical protein [Amycolatopsis thermophila]
MKRDVSAAKPGRGGPAAARAAVVGQSAASAEPGRGEAGRAAAGDLGARLAKGVADGEPLDPGLLRQQALLATLVLRPDIADGRSPAENLGGAPGEPDARNDHTRRCPRPR